MCLRHSSQIYEPKKPIFDRSIRPQLTVNNLKMIYDFITILKLKFNGCGAKKGGEEKRLVKLFCKNLVLNCLFLIQQAFPLSDG